MRCSEPGHRALIAIHASRGPVAELESLGGRGDSWFFVHLN
jgi:hypothetical protein